MLLNIYENVQLRWFKATRSPQNQITIQQYALIIKQGEKEEHREELATGETFWSVSLSLFFFLFLPLFAADRSSTPKGLSDEKVNDLKSARVLKKSFLN